MSKTAKPLWGMLLAFIGGIIILIAGALGSVGTVFAWGGLALVGSAGLIGVVMGILIILFAVLMYFMPKNKMIFGLIIIILAILNLLLGWDILVVGMLLSVIGGILGGFMGM